MVKELCPICQEGQAIIESSMCRLEETNEYLYWSMIAPDDDEAFEIVQDMKRRLSTIRNDLDWDGDLRLFPKRAIQPCVTCQGEASKKMADHHSAASLLSHGVSSEHSHAAISKCPSWVQKYVDQNLLLFGPVGTGKTFIAAALARHCVEKGFEYHFMTMTNLLQEIRDCFNNNSGTTDSDLIRYYQNVANLFLDDIGVEKISGWVHQTIYQVLDHRFSNNKRTVITSNLSPPRMEVCLGQRITSRILGACKTPEELTGQDLRLRTT